MIMEGPSRSSRYLIHRRPYEITIADLEKPELFMSSSQGITDSATRDREVPSRLPKQLPPSQAACSRSKESLAMLDDRGSGCKRDSKIVQQSYFLRKIPMLQNILTLCTALQISSNLLEVMMFRCSACHPENRMCWLCTVCRFALSWC